MKFNLGEKVKFRATGRTGEVRMYKHELYLHNGSTKESIKYYVHFPPFTNEWYSEDQLQHLLEVDSKFEFNFLEFLIDMNLKDGNYDMVKNFNEQKEKLGWIMPSINEHKRTILLDHLTQLEDGLSDLFHCIEEDEGIPEDQFRVYEKRIQKLLSVYNELKEEVDFS